MLEAFSRHVVGWSMRHNPTAALTSNALGMAVKLRGSLLMLRGRMPAKRPWVSGSPISVSRPHAAAMPTKFPATAPGSKREQDSSGYPVITNPGPVDVDVAKATNRFASPAGCEVCPDGSTITEGRLSA